MRPASDHLRSAGRHPPVLVLAAGLLVWAAMFVREARRLWFAGDDFNFLLHRSISFTGDHNLLQPHNEHWSTVPIVLFRLNYALFGLHHYLPYALLPIACHVAVCVLLFALLRTCDVAPWVAALAALVATFTVGATGAENTLWDFQVGFLGSCLLGLIALLLFATRRWNTTGRVIGVGALVLALMSSGMGLVMVVWSGVYVLMRDGLRAAVATVAVPAVVYLLWFAAYGHQAASASPVQPRVAPFATMHGLAYVWSAASGVPNSGTVILLALVAAVVLPRLDKRVFVLAASGLVTVLATYVLLGYSRSGFGVDATERSRYVYFGLVFTIPALAAAFDQAARALAIRPVRIRVIAWLTVAFMVVTLAAAQGVKSARIQRSLSGDNKAHLVAAAALVASGAPVLRTMPMPERNPDVDVSALEEEGVREALPEIDPGPRAELDVAAHLQVDVGQTGHALPTSTGLVWRGFAKPRRSESVPKSDDPGVGCVERTALAGAVIEVPPTDSGSELRVSVTGQAIDTGLRTGGMRSMVVSWPVDSGRPLYISSVASDATLRIIVPPGTVTVCGSSSTGTAG